MSGHAILYSYPKLRLVHRAALIESPPNALKFALRCKETAQLLLKFVHAPHTLILLGIRGRSGAFPIRICVNGDSRSMK